MGGFQLGASSHIKLSQGAFRGNPPVSNWFPLLLVGFPDSCQPATPPLPTRHAVHRLSRNACSGGPPAKASKPSQG